MNSGALYCTLVLCHRKRNESLVRAWRRLSFSVCEGFIMNCCSLGCERTRVSFRPCRSSSCKLSWTLLLSGTSCLKIGGSLTSDLTSKFTLERSPAEPEASTVTHSYCRDETVVEWDTFVDLPAITFEYNWLSLPEHHFFTLVLDFEFLQWIRHTRRYRQI